MTLQPKFTPQKKKRLVHFLSHPVCICLEKRKRKRKGKLPTKWRPNQNNSATHFLGRNPTFEKCCCEYTTETDLDDVTQKTQLELHFQDQCRLSGHYNETGKLCSFSLLCQLITQLQLLNFQELSNVKFARSKKIINSTNK